MNANDYNAYIERYWHFNEAYTGYRQDATRNCPFNLISGSVAWEASKSALFGNCAAPIGNGFRTPQEWGGWSSIDNRWYSFWLYLNATAVDTTIFEWGFFELANPVDRLYYNGTTLYFYREGGSLTASYSGIPIGSWFHVICYGDGGYPSTITLYVNAVHGTQFARIGSGITGNLSWVAGQFSGKIDEMVVWHGATLGSDANRLAFAQAVYNGGTGVILSGGFSEVSSSSSLSTSSSSSSASSLSSSSISSLSSSSLSSSSLSSLSSISSSSLSSSSFSSLSSLSSETPSSLSSLSSLSSSSFSSFSSSSLSSQSSSTFSSKSSPSSSSPSSISSLSSSSVSSLSSSSPSTLSSVSSSSLSSSSLSSISSSSSSSYNPTKTYKNITGTLLNNNISMDIRNITTENSIDVQVTLFSNKFSYADIEFEYRTDFGEQWMNDAFVSTSTAKFINGNKLFRLPCSSTGYSNVVRWEYEKNSLTTGNNIQIKIKVIPSLSTFNNYGYYTIVENVYSNMFNEIESIIPYKIISLDNYGNYLCFDQNRFIVVDREKKIIMQYSGIKNVVCCQQIWNDNYFILDNDDKKIIEMSKNGDLIYEFQSTTLFSNPIYFVYNKYSNNILLTDKNKHIVYEICWNNINKGDIIWQYGSYGTGISNLNYPTAAIYDSENRAIIWIADSGNKRIVKVDRGCFADDIAIYDHFTKDNIDVSFNPISKMFSNKNDLILVEQTPEQEFFNTNRNLHPALARALDLKDGGIANKNNLEDYENLLFKPITETIDL